MGCASGTSGPPERMHTYLVGGAVRDKLLGKPVRERDWVVVGSTATNMRRLGFTQVGRDFPVFLHPKTKEQYALARTERRTGPGHADFDCDAAPDVTLEEDLARRDLTINAIAESGSGQLIDPYGGRKDLAKRQLRHVSPAFREDPLRVFRVARFAAQLPDFSVHEDTLALMNTMTTELAALSGERVWSELSKAAAAACPARFFEVAQSIGGTCWFAPLDLPATVALYQKRTFEHGDHALAALGWVNQACAVDSVFTRLRAKRILHRAARAVSIHGRTLTDPGTEGDALLAALTAIQAFRQGSLAALVLAAAARCADRVAEPLLQLVERLQRLRADAEPGPAYGAALRLRRLATIEAWREPETPW